MNKNSTVALVVAATLAAALAAPRVHAGPQEDLAACGAITDPTERLACYDRLAGRPVAPASRQPATATPGAAPAPTSSRPAGAAAPAAAANPAAPPAQVQGAAAASSFGSYPVEHPNAAPAVPGSLSAQVTAMGKTIDGRPTVTLEGGALWLLDEADPLLAVGDTVTIKRGVLGSFLLETSGKRMHHVRRIR